jgi:hypothetical protein
MTDSVPSIDGRARHLADALWSVPDDYYDDYRSWYGHVHRNVSWTCFEYGDLLVVGPAVRGSQLLSGTPCLFKHPANGWARQAPGYYSWIMNRWGRDECVATYRLAPIHVCSKIDRIDSLWYAKEYVLPCQNSSSSFREELLAGTLRWEDLVSSSSSSSNRAGTKP